MLARTCLDHVGRRFRHFQPYVIFLVSIWVFSLPPHTISNCNMGRRRSISHAQPVIGVVGVYVHLVSYQPHQSHARIVLGYAAPPTHHSKSLLNSFDVSCRYAQSIHHMQDTRDASSSGVLIRRTTYQGISRTWREAVTFN